MTAACATCGPVPAGAIRHLDHNSPHGHETHECGSSAGLDWTKKEHDMSDTAARQKVPAVTCGPDCEASYQRLGNQANHLVQQLNAAKVARQRIAEAHHKHIDAHGGTFGGCNECGNSWPCPTYAWATTDRDPLATWDPADDESVTGTDGTTVCGHQYVGDEGEFACDKYTHDDDKHWNSLAEFGWTGEVTA